jgi:hypothetical protein
VTWRETSTPVEAGATLALVTGKVRTITAEAASSRR